MGRISQTKGLKGSLKWIQHVVNECTGVLNIPINEHIVYAAAQPIEWLAPKVEDNYAKYRDLEEQPDALQFLLVEILTYRFQRLPELLY
jgi:hypothetical protein